LHRRQIAADAQEAAFTELNVAHRPGLSRADVRSRRRGATFPQIFIGATHVGGCDELYALDRAGKLDACWREKRLLMSAGSTFTAAMVQMRTGLLPEPSLEQGTRLIREAAAQGADYVLTPR
jgi:glutaredoxin